jgi:hypothetical protein
MKPQPFLRQFLAVLLMAIALGAVVLWALPALLTRHPSHEMSAPDQLKAVNDARAPLVAFVVAIGAGGTLWFTSRNYILNREGHVTDRYTKAVGQLGNESSAVRVGGVYALERIGNDSPHDRTTIIYVLGAFVRERSRVRATDQDDPPEDVKAGLRAAGRLLQSSEVVFDLRDANLHDADLSGLPRERLLLEGANVEGAQMPR